MLDDVPARVWIVLALCAAAYAPTSYLYRHLVHSPSRRDITQPQEDLSWRTPRQFALSATGLCVLVGLGIFVFTPAAVDFYHSPSFWPILIGLIGAYAGYETVKGLMTGSVEPMSRGRLGPYSRAGQPIRYYLSILWNAAMAGMLLYFAFSGASDLNGGRASPEAERCFNSDRQSSEDALAACTTLIDNPEASHGFDRAELIAARGRAHHRLYDYQLALEDYGEAIRLDPDNTDNYYNRGLVYERLDKSSNAIKDFDAAIRHDPDYADAFVVRGWHYGRRGDMKHAIADFSQAIRLKPDLAEAHCFRGHAYQKIGKQQEATADFASAMRLNPKIVKATCASG